MSAPQGQSSFYWPERKVVFSVSVPVWPVSTNNAYTTVESGSSTIRVKTSKTRDAERSLRMLLCQGKADRSLVLPGRYYGLHVALYGRFESKSRRPLKIDIDNRLKQLQDVLAAHLMLDDRSFSVIRASKMHADETRTDITVWTPTEQDYIYAP